MSLNLKPLLFNLPSVVTGDTFPAVRFTETEADSNLTRVRMKVKAIGGTEALLTLDSDSTGMTINTATAGAWSFDIDQIDEVTLDAATYLYDIETTDAAGTIRTEFAGNWKILTETTD